ncbi:hypothetical protein [Methylobacterium aquaticum]|uniref:Uncharacterized protein n=1 Tax=Methylobacterium aquaticum TaxID=270351 RepID=A0A0C6FCB1_9HYPH|nr:hypothetical protein [Methylobacterium aquaticum]BAQ50311.1 hypothetical protein Maq22A_3p50300 [Methylobacterium aquaticum]
MRSILTLALLAGLTALPSPASAQPASRADKAQVLAWAKNFFSDPYSLRSTEISDRAVVKGVEVVCVAFNAKNAYGGYVGVYRKPFEVRGETLVTPSSRVDAGTCHQPGIVMRPFPELASIR